MDAMEVVAVLILIVAIAVLVYYYLLNSPSTMDKLKTYVPTSADAHMEQVLNNSPEYNDLTKEDVESEKDESVTKRIKVKLSDIDMSGINTDAFSNKIDAFLDAKSEELIKDWSLATTDDLEDLQTKFSVLMQKCKFKMFPVLCTGSVLHTYSTLPKSLIHGILCPSVHSLSHVRLFAIP